MAYAIQKDQFLFFVVVFFLGILFSVFFMGAHRSPKATPRTANPTDRMRTPPSSRVPRREPYPSNKSDYK